MSLLPPIRSFRRHLGLLVVAIALTQVPALPLLLLSRNLGLVGIVAYVVASLAAALGASYVALAYWERFERIVSLIRGYAEHRRLPLGDDVVFGSKGPLDEIKASLASLDGVVKNLEEEASRDHLTGILNRRTCVSRLEVDLARALRSGTPFSLAIFDLDDLKTINDEYGHAAGDAALRHLAKALATVTREGDWVARWGGDEFVLGLWDADGEAAKVVAQRIFKRLASDPAAFGESRAAIGTSAGIGQAKPDDDPSRLFARADAALMLAKRGGRRRVELSSA